MSAENVLSSDMVREVEDQAMSAETVLSSDIVGEVEDQAAKAIALIVLLSSAPGTARTRMKSIGHIVNMYHDTLHAAVLGHYDEAEIFPIGSATGWARELAHTATVHANKGRGGRKATVADLQTVAAVAVPAVSKPKSGVCICLCCGGNSSEPTEITHPHTNTHTLT